MPRMSYTAISLIALLGFSPALCAQSTKAPSLDAILERLERNLNHYDTAVPSFYCDEHAISSRTQPKVPDATTITDSIFRLKRIIKDGQTAALVESREIKSINGKPPNPKDDDPPSELSGLFEGGLDVASLDQTACINYKLKQLNKNHRAESYIIRFATVLTPQNTAACFFKEDSKGQVFVDPATMQVTHVEITTPHHVIDAARYMPRIVGKRKLTVDYAPVQFDGQTFWMPSEVNMLVTSGSSFDTVAWSFHATYRNYHKLEVTSHIVPNSTVYTH
ncbi:hypothetical protein GCM10011507_00530 [Edaphobacter acidisoli]|uniref:Uncharacterized protein n=1 Tax=Edaphobacter acidisoli TaxID=2040573 RepID=A0A916VYH6_9BACT|nr:hypothetical protein [Edaphobacter acidisoli]GGA53360.1 hypothetical protein GCM10011507_00530 [Edaphobacter acidisoli]